VTHNLHEALRMADRIMILQRRPGRVREIISVTIPRADRQRASARQELEALYERLWSHIRQEAQIADREMTDG
jgi:NitT/TauT family transport system ATP-binding protein